MGEEGFGSIRNHRDGRRKCFLTEAWGNMGGAQELSREEWDELLARLGLEDVESAETSWRVACSGSGRIPSIISGGAMLHVRPTRSIG